MHTQSVRRLAVMLLLLAAIFGPFTGCKTAESGSAALTEIHRSYRDEFARLVMPLEPGKPAHADFSRTLKAIDDFKANHPGASKEDAHLTVLKAMIHVQSGNIGMARAMQGDVAAAAAQLRSPTGKHTRDELFATAFDPLIRGWTDVHGGRPNNNDMRRAGDDIAAILKRLDTGGTGSELDEGAIYLAATAAAFRTPWLANAEPAEQTSIATDSYQLIGRYLTPEEQTAARTESYGGISPGRIRYLKWYRAMWIEAGRPAAS
jgi:hypothetical protein